MILLQNNLSLVNQNLRKFIHYVFISGYFTSCRKHSYSCTTCLKAKDLLNNQFSLVGTKFQSEQKKTFKNLSFHKYTKKLTEMLSLFYLKE